MNDNNNLGPSYLTIAPISVGILCFLLLTNFHYVLFRMGFETSLTSAGIGFREISGRYGDTFFNQPVFATLSNGLVWGLVGVVVYFLFSLFWHLFIDAENNLLFMTKFVHPRGYTVGRYLLHLAREVLLKNVCVLVIILDVYFFVRAGYGLASLGFRTFLFNLTSLEGWLSLVLAYCLLLIQVYIGLLAVRLLHYPTEV